ncbi:MAG: hypothetical protein HZA95_04115 [Candidatus Vogelbacteria bacterium]|nr:hypothetical protein [Candidatus Vogelbacteria bacterium]
MATDPNFQNDKNSYSDQRIVRPATTPVETSRSFNLPTQTVSVNPKLSWTAKRQFSYLILFTIVASGVAYGVYFQLSPKATCSDGIRNQGETAVDCGGACERVCQNEVEDLRIQWSKVFPSNEGSYDVAALISNPNLMYGLNSVHYRFKLYDLENKLVAERDGMTFVNPGELFAIYEPNIMTGDRRPVRAYVQFEDPDYVLPWRRAVIPVRPLLTVSNPSLRVAVSPELEARVVNKSIADAAGVQAIAVLFDKDEIPLGVRSTYLDVIKRNETIPLTFSWSIIPEGSTAAGAAIYPRSSAEGIK